MQNNENVAGKSAFLLLSLINVFYIIVLLIAKSQPKEKRLKSVNIQWYFWPKTNRVNHSTDKFQIKVFSNNSYATKDILKI